jgi:hypothetical protein
MLQQALELLMKSPCNHHGLMTLLLFIQVIALYKLDSTIQSLENIKQQLVLKMIVF